MHYVHKGFIFRYIFPLTPTNQRLKIDKQDTLLPPLIRSYSLIHLPHSASSITTSDKPNMAEFHCEFASLGL